MCAIAFITIVGVNRRTGGLEIHSSQLDLNHMVNRRIGGL